MDKNIIDKFKNEQNIAFEKNKGIYTLNGFCHKKYLDDEHEKYDITHNMETHHNINELFIEQQIETMYENIINNKCKKQNCLDEIIYLKQQIKRNNKYNSETERRRFDLYNYYLDENYNLTKQPYFPYTGYT